MTKLTPKKIVALIIIIILLLVLTASNKPKPEAVKPPSFNKSKYSLNQASSLWVVVNKGRILSSAYVPSNLVTPSIPLNPTTLKEGLQIRSDAALALEQMDTAAHKDGISFMLASGYRSYDDQTGLYKYYLSVSSQAETDSLSARPGHSEHQTGLAADLEGTDQVCEVEECYANTPSGKWLDANSWRYGFIIRYPNGKQSVTGYAYEPWHVRFLGKDLAAQIHKSGLTLEQFFSLPNYSDYPATNIELSD